MASQIIGKSSFMQKLESFLGLTSSSKREFLILQTTFRVLTIIFVVIAISVMVTSSQSIVLFGFTFKASYSYSSALKFLVGAEAVVCVFSALSLIFVYLQYRSESHPTNYFFLFLHDMFCNRTVVSVVFSYLAFFAYLTLTIVSATKLRSRATE
ncbi:casp-like protein 1f3 [Quercus suber]|uniref:CASP-like protein n=1 Tax=Quercus suber TaxID=58331 RepID=A0AAW0JJL0_QUESU